MLVFEFFQLILKVLDEGLFFIELTVDFDEFPVMLEIVLSEFSIKFVGFGKGLAALFFKSFLVGSLCFEPVN